MLRPPQKVAYLIIVVELMYSFALHIYLIKIAAIVYIKLQIIYLEFCSTQIDSIL